ncbi:MAG: hypothetical protein AABN33_05970 [Acidobacteriota bacterium]
MNNHLEYDPGVLPPSPAPSAGDEVAFKLEGMPPYKDEHFSIRNPRHKIHGRFVALRKMAIDAMAGRARYSEAVSLNFDMHAPEFERGRSLLDYVSGIMDTLDGSHGVNFTYLPIVYEDDCQVAAGRQRFVKGEATWYEIKILFLG